MALKLSFAGVELADGITKTLTLGSIDGSHAVQIEAPIGAAGRSFFDRLTRSKRVRFTVLRGNSSFARSLYQVFVGIDQLPGTGSLVLTLTTATATHTFTATAAKPSQAGVVLGLSDTTDYSFEADVWTYATTAIEESAADIVDGNDAVLTTTVDGGNYVDKTPTSTLDGGLET